MGKAGELEIGRGSRCVRFTRLRQRWWPEQGILKADVVGYYRRVAPVLVPHLRNRPFTMKRHYNGPRSPFEWVKDAPQELPDWIPVSPQPARSRRGARVRGRGRGGTRACVGRARDGRAIAGTQARRLRRYKDERSRAAGRRALLAAPAPAGAGRDAAALGRAGRAARSRDAWDARRARAGRAGGRSRGAAPPRAAAPRDGACGARLT